MSNVIKPAYALHELNQILLRAKSTTGIQNNLNSIIPLIELIEQEFPQVLQEAVNMIKGMVQQEANESILSNNLSPKRGMLAMATGSGKSRIPVMQIKEHYNQTGEDPTVLIIVPTEKLRDTGWRDEFTKWGASEIYRTMTVTTCYASLQNFIGKTFTYVIADEAHNFTTEKVKALKQITCSFFYCLTATPPKDRFKQALFTELNVKITYHLSLDTAVLLRMVSPFHITVVEIEMDDKEKVVPSGNAKNRFMTTEAQAYKYLDQKTQAAMMNPKPAFPGMVMMKILARMNMIKKMKCKQDAAEFILDMIPPEMRGIIFAGGIDQCINLCKDRYFSKPSIKKTDKPAKVAQVQAQLDQYTGEDALIAFQNKEINRIACVDRLNEGVNLPDVDYAVAVQLNSNDTDFIQRLGRLIRYKIGHTGEIILLIVKGTQDVNWSVKALESIDPSKIRRISFTDLKSGKAELFNENSIKKEVV